MLTRWSPRNDFTLMRRMLDRAFGDEWQQMMDDMGTGSNILAVDVDEDHDAYTVTTSLPGVKAENIDIQVNGDQLSISVEIPEKVAEEKEGQRAIMRERHYGMFRRTMRLPQRVDSEGAEARFEDGVLELKLPKAEEAKSRSIPVRSSMETSET